MKRFSQNTRSKISCPVKFPIKGLDLKPFLLNDEISHAKYNLYGVSHHSGSLHGGHYTAVAKNPNGHWYDFNDDSTRQIVAPSGVSSSAYLLFYQLTEENYTPPTIPLELGGIGEVYTEESVSASEDDGSVE